MDTTITQSPQPQIPTKFICRRIRRWVVLFAIIPYLTISITWGMFQRYLVFQGQLRSVPSLVGIYDRVEDVKITTNDGLRLNGWYYPQRELAIHSPPYVVAFFSGADGHRLGRCRELVPIHEMGLEVVHFDYRGYANNPGSPTEETIADDARRVWAFIREDLGRPSDRIIVMGESLGGAVATRLAFDMCQSNAPPAALILNSTFTSLTDIAEYHYPWMPVRWMLRDRFPTVDRIASVTCPVLVFHGEDDRIIPLDHGRRLLATAPQRSVGGLRNRLIEIPGMNHDFVSPNVLRAELSRLLDSLESSSLQTSSATPSPWLPPNPSNLSS